MAREGKIGYKRKTRNEVRLGKKGSDESDEDYNLAEDEVFDESEDDYCSSLAEDETEESLGDLEEEEVEEEWVEKKVKKVGRRSGRRGIQGSKKKRVVKQRKQTVDYSEEEEEEEEEEDYDDDDYDFAKESKRNKLSRKEDDFDDTEFLCRQVDNLTDRKSRKNSRVSCTETYKDGNTKKPRKKSKVSYREEYEDGDDSDDDDDVEFTPDDLDGLDDEEELLVSKKNKVVSRPRVEETRIAKGQRRKRNANNLKRTKRNKPVKERAFRRKNRLNLAREQRADKRILREKTKDTERGKGRKRLNMNSDSDFVSSGSSDYEYTISEEEREQVREATELCKRLANNSRSSSSVKLIKEEEMVSSPKKRPIRKGKEKVADLKIEVGKQVCGICLSEEGKRTIRGILNCCSHYFCFACIMEWSKVETRCPLCKQRFATISRTARADGGHDLRDAVISVPERDQVYQPSEEELRGYLDPYENVLCTECHEGGDDGFMLLCDLCDSPAHTYCVGLGHEVPDGNWYCDGCRPTALASANSQVPNPPTDCGASNTLSAASPPVAPTIRETFDLNEAYVPETPLTQVTVPLPSPRHPFGDSQAISPSSGSGANTVSERRRIQRQIQNILSNWHRQPERRDNEVPESSISLFGSQIGRDVMMAHQQALMPVRLTPQSIYHQGRLPDYSMPLYSREMRSPRANGLREQALRNQASTSTGLSLGMSHREFAAINASFGGGLGHQQVHPCSGTSHTGPEASAALPYQFREVSHSSHEKEQVQSMVKSHLKSLARNFELGYSTFKDIARTSTHTILAAAGLDHRRNEVIPVRARLLICDHFEQTPQIAGQCLSCFERFVRNVVREIMYTHHVLPHLFIS